VYDATAVGVFRVATAAVLVASLIAFATLFDPNMRGNERALVNVALTAALVGAAGTIIVRRGLGRSSAAVVPIALLLVALLTGIMSIGDLRTDRGNKKALVALGVAAFSGSALVTSLFVRRSRDEAIEPRPDA
jgi:hypothetical protein